MSSILCASLLRALITERPRAQVLRASIPMACVALPCHCQPVKQRDWLPGLARLTIDHRSCPAKLQQFGDFRALNDLARLSINPRLHFSSDDSVVGNGLLVFDFHTIVLPVHTEYRPDRIARRIHQADDGPRSAYKSSTGKLLMV